MTDFTSSLYLGLRHPSNALRSWDTLTSGVPSVLGTPAISRKVAASLASLQGCEAATLGSSTLHLFWDLFDILRKDNIVICFDRGAYPIARWGVERVFSKGFRFTGLLIMIPMI